MEQNGRAIYARSGTETSPLDTIVIWPPRSTKSDVNRRFSRARGLYDLPPPHTTITPSVLLHRSVALIAKISRKKDFYK